MSHENSSDSSIPAFSRLEALAVVVVLGVLALALGLTAFAMPTRTTDERVAEYVQTGAFSYESTDADAAIYGADGLSTGDPILADAVRTVTARFSYVFEADAGAELQGSAGLVATVELDQGLSRSFTVAPKEEFTGPEVTVAGRLPVDVMAAFLQDSQDALGETTYAQATVTLAAEVRVDGRLDGKPLDATYAPELSFESTGSTLTLTAGEQTTPEAEASDPLEPTEGGELTYTTEVANTVPLLVVEPTVTVARWVGVAAAVLFLSWGLLLARPLLGSGDRADEKARIRTLYASRLVEVRSLQLTGGSVADVASMDALAELAKRYESMIMHVDGPDGEAYLVWDNGLVYRYRPVTATAVPERPAAAATGRGDAPAGEDASGALLTAAAADLDSKFRG